MPSSSASSASSVELNADHIPRSRGYAALGEALHRSVVQRVRIVPATTSSSSSPVVPYCSDCSQTLEITEMTFLREFVAKSIPCVLVGLTDNWPALTKWRDDAYLFQLDRSSDTSTSTTKVTVALTPNGRADCITDVIHQEEVTTDDGKMTKTSSNRGMTYDRLFMTAAEVQMSLPALHRAFLKAKQDAYLLTPLKVNIAGVTKQKQSSSSAGGGVDDGPEQGDIPLWEHLKQQTLAADQQQGDAKTSAGVSSTGCRAEQVLEKLSKPLPVIPYAQLQNNCLESEYSHLLPDLNEDVRSFGERVFGVPCEAANVWLGTHLSVTSMHQDWYENLFAVVRGVKMFTLIAPWESALARREVVRSAAYSVVPDGGPNGDDEEEGFQFQSTLLIGPVEEASPWIGVDLHDTPEPERQSRNPELQEAHPVQVDVHAGEVLYLPAMWLHRVAQREEPEDDTCVVGVNYWFDMQMDGPLYHMVMQANRDRKRDLDPPAEDLTDDEDEDEVC